MLKTILGNLFFQNNLKIVFKKFYRFGQTQLIEPSLNVRACMCFDIPEPSLDGLIFSLEKPIIITYSLFIIVLSNIFALQ